VSKSKSTRKKTTRKTTALARVSKPSLATLERRLQRIQPGATLGPTLPTLPDMPIMLAPFVGTLKLKPQQVAALRQKFTTDEMDWKAARKDGPPEIPYPKHTAVRDRLDAAFGLGGWGIAPIGIPKEKDDIVLLPCALVIGGTPRFQAWGEVNYRNNPHMTYGDVLEGCKTNAMTRCAKELGVARELWDRDYVRSLPRPGSGPSRQRDAKPRSAPAYDDGGGDMPISDKQRRRMFAIARNAGRTEQEVRAWLAVAYNISSTKDIRRADYERICEALESRAPLPEPSDREPGEEG